MGERSLFLCVLCGRSGSISHFIAEVERKREGTEIRGVFQQIEEETVARELRAVELSGAQP